MGKAAGSEPQRTCIACRRGGDKHGFLRFVLSPDGVVTPDLEERLPGRGAYLCQAEGCLKQAAAKGLFGRAFKANQAVQGVQDLLDLLPRQMLHRITGYLSLATKAKATVSGGESVEKYLAGRHRTSLMLVAVDAAPASLEKLLGNATRQGVAVEKVLTKEQLGLALGKESDRSAVLITNDGFARSLQREIERFRNYLDKENGR